MFHNKRPLVLALIMLVSIGLVLEQSVVLFSVYASESSAYETGYDHGCQDATIGTSRFMDGPSTTNDYAQGYVAGFNACGGSNMELPSDTADSQEANRPPPVSSSGGVYNRGYDDGCNAAKSGNSRPLPEGVLTEYYENGYADGFASCGGSSGGGGGRDDRGDGEPGPESEPPMTGGINWENLCNQYGHLVGIKDPCYEYANGTQLTEKGRTALVCLLGGAVTLLATLDPATKAEIIALGNQYCP